MKKLAILQTASVVALATFAQAQPVAAQGLLDEILVTATRREENVQDVPLAVTAYSGDLLEASGIRDIRGLISVSPSLYLAATQSEAAGANARIRGVGTVGDNPGLESSVGVFIDGVYRSRNSTALGELGEIQSVEVLRGPQGTLFGRNVSSGALSINSKLPEYEFGAVGEFTYGNFDYIRGSAALTGPIIEDTLAARAYVAYEKRDGFLDDLNSDRDFNDRDRIFARGQLLYEPTDALSARLIFDYSDRDETCCAAATIEENTSVAAVNAVAAFFRPDVAVGQVSPPDPFAYEATVTPGRGYQQDVEDWGVSGEINYELDFGTLTSITAYREFDARRSQDIDYTGIDIAFRPEDGFLNTFETFTQELRLNGVFGDLDWLIGAFYTNEDITLEDRITLGEDYETFLNFIGDGLFPGSLGAGLDLDDITAPFGGVDYALVGEDDRFTQSSESIAVFTHNIWSITDRFDATVGLRFTHEEKEQTGSLSSNNAACGTLVAAAAGPLGAFDTLDGVAGVSDNEATLAGLACPANILADTPLTAAVGIAPLNTDFAQSRTENEVTGTVKLSYKVTDDALTYVSYARGYKAGGFNLDRGGLNNAVFGILDPTTAPDPSNLEFGEETVDAFELGLKTSWFDGTLNANLALFHSQFDDYQLNTFNGLNFVVENIEEVKSSGVEFDLLSSPIDGLVLQGGVTYADTRFGDDITSTIVSSNGRGIAGRRLPLAPLWVGTASITYGAPLPGLPLRGFGHVDLRYDSGSNTGSDLDPEKIQEEFVLVNARLGVATLDETWELEVWSRNIFDEEYIQVGFDQFAQLNNSFGAFLGDPRTFGVTLRATY